MASRSINKVTLIGNLTRDPELKYTPNGTAVCTFGVATNRSWKTATGDIKEDAQFHRIVAWQKLAELCGKLLGKGSRVFLEGRIVYRTYTDKDGIQRTITEIVMDDFVVFDYKKTGESTGAEDMSSQPDIEMSIPSEDAPSDEPEKTKVEKKSKGKKDKPEDAENDETEEKVDPEDIPF